MHLDCAPVAQPSLSIVVPAYNEEQELPVLLRALRVTLDDLALEGEILVVDNASTDDTRARSRRSSSTACDICATTPTAARATRSGAGCSRRRATCG